MYMYPMPKATSHIYNVIFDIIPFQAHSVESNIVKEECFMCCVLYIGNFRLPVKSIIKPTVCLASKQF